MIKGTELYFQKFIEASNKKETNINSKWLINITSGFFIWKLLSRDFVIFSYLPSWAMERSPAFVYNPEQAYYILDFGIFLKIASFHFIHYFVEYPDAYVLEMVRYICILSFVLIILFGRGPRRIFAICAYVSVMYLWGFIFKSGQEIDAMFLPMGILFCYMFSNFNEKYNKQNLLRKTKDSSIFIYSCLMIFVIYYFGSGINKLTDIPLSEWFQYDLYGQIEHAVLSQQLGADRFVPEIFHKFVDYNFNNVGLIFTLGVPIIYLFHLLAPIIILKTNYLIYTFLFYAVFHFLAFGVGISFTANILIWIGFINISNLFIGNRPYYGYK